MIPGLYDFATRWSEGGSVYLLGDTHFDDEDRDIMGYKLSSEEQHRLIKVTINKNDTFIHLGDVGNPEYLTDVPGYKVLIMGNHDQSVERFRPYFDEIYSGPLMISKKIILSHEPVDVPWAFNIHGHNHNWWNPGDDHHLNLAANVCAYYPVSLKHIIRQGYLNKITDIHRFTIDKAREGLYEKSGQT